MTGRNLARGSRPAFTHVMFKSLSVVEADASRSNQHEFNGSRAMRDAFGDDARRLETDFVWMPDDGEWLSDSGLLTWYDARARHPVRSEYRLYYRDNVVTCRASAGDVLLIGLRPDGRALALLASGSGLAAARIFWLFGIEVRPGSAFAALDIDGRSGRALAARLNFGSPRHDHQWEAAPAVAAARGSRKVRPAAALAQSQLGKAAAGADAGWADVDLHLPGGPPEGLAGEALERTIRGIVAPGSRL